MAHELLARETAGFSSPATIAAGLQRACVRVSANLRRSIGDAGYDAIFARAVRSMEAEHPVLTHIRRADGAGIYLDEVSASVELHGVPVVTAALETLLASLFDILGSLVGADMVWNLIDDDGLPSPTLTRQEKP